MFNLNPSHWERHRGLGSYDVVIIGTGMVGLWTAYLYLLRKPGKKVLLLDKLPSGQAGASTRNAGFACFGSPTELLDDLRHEKEEDVIQRLRWRYEGLISWRGHFEADQLDWCPENGHEVFTNGEKDSYHSVLASLEHLNALAKAANIPGKVYQIGKAVGPQLPHSIQICHEAGLHPGKGHQALTSRVLELGGHLHRGILVPQKSEWTRIDQTWKIPTSQGIVYTSQVVIAANAWSSELLPHLDVIPGRGQILLTSAISELPFQGTYHADAGYIYFRNVGKRLLLGGGRNVFRQAEESHQAMTTAEVQIYLEAYARDVLLPNIPFEVEERWAGIMAFSSDGSKMPYVHSEGEDCFVAARMGGMGVALSPVVGQQMAVMLH